eukprot:TRINITY_DN25295_c0_g1_i4.p1 TRINITY_DN25295_c0_g1~~TRINITY_DN25295_c0_g1_i4.p1  ORF type:complete len:650 (-),score=121.89 TRINITY_DN25295_c0_g1_i4:186-2135(-)
MPLGAAAASSAAYRGNGGTGGAGGGSVPNDPRSRMYARVAGDDRGPAGAAIAAQARSGGGAAAPQGSGGRGVARGSNSPDGPGGAGAPGNAPLTPVDAAAPSSPHLRTEAASSVWPAPASPQSGGRPPAGAAPGVTGSGDLRGAEVLRWLLPLLCLTAALLLMNVCLAGATAAYVKWMDELSYTNLKAFEERLQQFPKNASRLRLQLQRGQNATAAFLKDFALEDEILAELGGHGLNVLSLEVVTAVAMLSWVVVAAFTRNLRLWTRCLLSATLCALLKAMVSCTTIMPDVDGWTGCQSRLGEGGLSYFRQLGKGEVGAFSALIDDLLLGVRGVWSLAVPQHTHYCADSFFSVPVCFCALSCLALYDAARRAASNLATTQTNMTARALSASVLFLLTLSNVVAAIANSYHYTSDVAFGLLIALLVYSSPAVAIVCEQWVSLGSSAQKQAAWPMWTALSCAQRTKPADNKSGTHHLLNASGATCLCWPCHDAAASLGADDLGVLSVPPCCLPFCGFAAPYYLRAEPEAFDKSAAAAAVEASTNEHRQRLARLGQASQEVARHEQALRKRLEEARTKERQREQEARADCDKQMSEALQAEKKRLEAHAARAVRDLQTRLAAEHKEHLAELKKLYDVDLAQPTISNAKGGTA